MSVADREDAGIVETTNEGIDGVLATRCSGVLGLPDGDPQV